MNVLAKCNECQKIFEYTTQMEECPNCKNYISVHDDTIIKNLENLSAFSIVEVTNTDSLFYVNQSLKGIHNIYIKMPKENQSSLCHTLDLIYLLLNGDDAKTAFDLETLIMDYRDDTIQERSKNMFALLNHEQEDNPND